MDPLTLPQNMRDLPVDERRDLPVPVMNVMPDGAHDFTAVNGPWILANTDSCGICGKALDYWIAFVGGPASLKSRSYVDPPFHETCAEAALRLCPHLAIKRHKRAPEHRVADGATTPEGWDESKPDAMFIAITRGFTIKRSGGAYVLRATPFKRVREFRYVDENLTEVTDG